MLFGKSKWIWADCEVVYDQYTEYLFYLSKTKSKTIINLSCDTDYTLFINGNYVASNQYSDFEHYKIYDTIDITNYLTLENNEIKILVYYSGFNTQRYIRGVQGLIFEILENDKIIAYSDENILSRLSPTYVSGLKRFITVQLGFSFNYDSTKENNFGYKNSVIVDKRVQFFPRPNEKLKVLPKMPVKNVTKESFGYLIDLGSEVVGLCALDFVSSCEQNIVVAYGESLDDGRVRANIEDRKFYFEYKAKKGENKFTNYMLRLACRYLEVVVDNPIDINYVGILPQVYSVEENSYNIENELDKRIYDISVNTLKLCMMEHYVDTPWREQCLYAFDSRNQMLFGYTAFKNGNTDYVRSNLKLLGEDRREDGLLSICSPCGSRLTIPACSLYYIIAIKEYIEFSNDVSLASEYIYRMEQILNAFLLNSSNGLIEKFTDRYRWNFYDWSDYLEGKLFKEDERIPDLIINCLFVLALDNFEEITKKCGVSFKYEGKANELRKLIYKNFYVENVGFTLHIGLNQFTNLGNALAVLSGVVKGEDAEMICDNIVSNKYSKATLSYSIFKYDALMLVNKEKYKDYILTEIRNLYKKMLDAGSTTVWETEEGSKAFDNAGSLSHGWSAVPVYIFNKYEMLK